MKHQIHIIVIAVLAGWLASCTGTSSSGMLVEYRRSGGFAGLDDRVVIQVNGQATLTRKAEHYEFVLDRDTMNQLQALFDDAEFSKLRREYLPPRQGSDLFEYVVTYNGHTVRTMDTAVPEALWPVLELLNQIIESGGKP
ncbi:MAG: hypothetical protein FJ014_07620 [Chloroflexi bacterium]|nr:hypothetical protein [Chloroflexota bacterium]